MAKKKLEKRKFIESIFNFEVFSKMLAQLREEQLTVKKDHDTETARSEEILQALSNLQLQKKKSHQDYSERKKTLLQRQKNNNEELEQIETRLVTFKPIDVEEVQKSLTTLNNKLVGCDEKINDFGKQIASLETKNDYCLAALNKIGTDKDICPTCLRPIDQHNKEQISNSKKEHRQQITQQEKEIKELEHKVEELTTLKTKILEAIRKCEKSISQNTISINQKIPTFIRNEDDSKQNEGAFVSEPKKGFQRNVVSFDANSLYPSVMVTLNLSPETKMGVIESQDKDNVIIRDVNGKSVKMSIANFSKLIKQEKLSLSKARVLFSQKHKGIIPEMVDIYYKLRVQVRKEHKKVKKQLAALAKTDPEYQKLKDENNVLNIKQHTIKIFINTVYGALGNKIFPLGDDDLARSITLTGQAVIKQGNKILTEYIKGRGSFTDRELEDDSPIIYNDTDSSYIRNAFAGTFISLDIGSGADFLIIGRTSGLAVIVQLRRSNGSVVTIITSSAVALGVHKIALGYTNGDYALYIDGVSAGTSTNSTDYPSAALTRCGLAVTSYNIFNDRIRAVALYTTRLTNAELAALTT